MAWGWVWQKLSSDNSKNEKVRVMEKFQSGSCKLLVSAGVCGRGIDVKGLSLVVNVGIPKTPWKFLQQCCRAGIEAQPSVAVTLKIPIKGRLAPESTIRNSQWD